MQQLSSLVGQEGPITAAQLLAGPHSAHDAYPAHQPQSVQHFDPQIQAFWHPQQQQHRQQQEFQQHERSEPLQQQDNPGGARVAPEHETDLAALQYKLRHHDAAAGQQAPHFDLTSMLQQHAAHSGQHSQQLDHGLTELLAQAAHAHGNTAPAYAQHSDADYGHSYVQQMQALQGLAQAHEQQAVPLPDRTAAQAPQHQDVRGEEFDNEGHTHGGAATLEEQLLAMHADAGTERGDADADDGRYLELLMQNAMSNLSRTAQDDVAFPKSHDIQ